MEKSLNRVRRIHKRTKDAQIGNFSDDVELDVDSLEEFLVKKQYSHITNRYLDLPSRTSAGTSSQANEVDSSTAALQRAKALTVAPIRSKRSSDDALIPVVRKRRKRLEMKNHPKFKLYRVVSGHTGWVRTLSFDPSNEWFCSGSADRTIKIWDLASGKLTLTLTGHVSTVRGLAVSERHPYIFSCGEDKSVFCWDLEYNTIVRRYHGHLSGVYCIAIHPKLDVIVTGGRDSCARVWDMRVKHEIFTLAGHTNTVGSLGVQSFDPQVVTGSYDTMIRTWDLRTGKTDQRLTHHKKSIRSLVIPRTEFTFLSGAADNIKYWKFPEPTFIRNFEGDTGVVNSMTVNEDGILASGSDSGVLSFWDVYSGKKYDEISTPVQPGSLDSEAGIYACSFDCSGTRIITGEADKTIKFYKMDDEPVPDSKEEDI